MIWGKDLMAIELTDRVAREVRTDRPDRGMRLHWDSAVKGFGLRITPHSVPLPGFSISDRTASNDNSLSAVSPI